MKFCPKCGARRLTDMPFCGSCGIDFRQLPVEAIRRRPWRQMLLAGLTLAAVVAMSVSACGGSSAASSTPGATTGPTAASVRATPEDAVRQYLEAVAAGDVQKLMQACAIDEPAEHWQFAYQAVRLNAIIPTSFLLPSEYAFYVEMNKYQQASRIFSQVRGLEYSLLSGKPTDQTIVPISEEQANQYVKDVDPGRLAGMKVLFIQFPVARFANDSKTLANFAANAKAYGADELTERVALIQWNGNYYGVGFQLVRYGKDWKVLSQVSNLAGTPYDGSAQPANPGDFGAST